MRDFETGIVYVNAGTTGAETHLPFGGMKETGNGHREAGHVALDTYTEWKSIYVDFSRAAPARPDRQPAGLTGRCPPSTTSGAIAMALPEAEEILTWETDITFRVRGKIFAIGGEGATPVSIKATPATQADLDRPRPETFHPSAYVGRFGWVTADLERVETTCCGP